VEVGQLEDMRDDDDETWTGADSRDDAIFENSELR
jgi:hypothetical protein